MLDLPQVPTAGPLRRLFAKSPKDILPGTLAKWGTMFVDDELRQGILDNPRLRGRIISEIMLDAPTVYPDDVLDTPDQAVITMLMNGQKAELVQAIGMAMHRPTIVDWVTWNTLGKNMADAQPTLVRAVIAADMPAGADDTDTIDPDLTQDYVLEEGATVLAAWAAGLEKPLLTRLRYFIDLEADVASRWASTYVQDVAFAVWEHDKGAHDD